MALWRGISKLGEWVPRTPGRGLAHKKDRGE